LKQASCSDARAETEHGVRRSFVVQPQYGLNSMRVGLERANSCHDHDGFQASPHQVNEDWIEKLAMENQTLLALLIGGFFGVACIRARAPLTPGHRQTLGEFFRLTGRIERLRRSRWQWFCMVLLMLVLRFQHQLPPAVEVMAGAMFLLFLIFPVRTLVTVQS
jgi:hypothetical protein